MAEDPAFRLTSSAAQEPTVTESPDIRIDTEAVVAAAVPESDDSRDTQTAAAAQAAPKPPEYFVAMALASNPRIRALRHRIAALECRIPQVSSLPDPAFQETFWPFNGNALETAGGSAVSQLGVMQPIPWPAKLDAKAAVACQEVIVARSELHEVENEIAESVKLACIEIWLADEALGIIDEFGALVSQLNKVSEARYRSGSQNSGQQDVLRAQLEADRLENRRVDLSKQKQLAQADLATLINRPRKTDIEAAPVFSEAGAQRHLEELIGLAEVCNPSLRGLASQISRDREKQRLANLQKFPDFQLGANWLIISDRNALSPVSTGNDNFGFTLGITLPVWRDKIAAGVAEATHQTHSAMNLLASERDSLAGKLRRLVTEVDALLEQKAILEQRIIPRTEDALKLSLSDYVGKRTDFPSVIDIYQERLLLELQLLRLKASVAGSLVQLERVVGCPVEAPQASPPAH